MTEYIIENEPGPISENRQNFWLLMRQTDAETGTQTYRRYEVIIDRNLDHVQYVADNIATLWSADGAYEISMGDWLRVEKGKLRNYYRAIMVAGYRDLMQDGGIAGAIAAADSVIAQVPNAAAEYAKVEAALQGATDEQLRTFIAQFVFSTTGETAGSQ